MSTTRNTSWRWWASRATPSGMFVWVVLNVAIRIVRPGALHIHLRRQATIPDGSLRLGMVSFPWTRPGVFEVLPFDKTFPSFKYKRDPLHTFKLGLGRDIAGGTIMLLCRFFAVFDSAGDSKGVVQRLERAHARFTMWASAHKKNPTCSENSPKTFSITKLPNHMLSLPRKAATPSYCWNGWAWNVAWPSARFPDHRRIDLVKAAAQVCHAALDVFLARLQPRFVVATSLLSECAEQYLTGGARL